MSIEDDVALLERVPTLRLLGAAALRMLAIGSELRIFGDGDVLFNAGEEADADLFFESANGVTQCRGRHAQALRRLGETALVGHRQKRRQHAQLIANHL